MQSYAEYRLWLVQERHAQEFRQVREAREARRSQRPAQPFRRTVGQSLVRVGERLAGEPYLEPARSR